MNARPFLIAILVVMIAAACTSNKPNNKAPADTVAPERSKVTTVAEPAVSEWIFDKVDGSVLRFKNGESYNTDLYALDYIGQIANGNKAPFLIFSGRDCDECDANISLYIHSPANGYLNIADGQNRYGMPGSTKDFEDATLINKSTAYYGEVLPDTKGIIWYQHDLMENGTWQTSTFIAQLKNGKVVDTTFTGDTNKEQTLKLLSQKRCKIITGAEQTTEP